MQKVHQNTPNYGIQKYFAKTKPSLSKAVTKPLSSTGTPTQLQGHGEIQRTVVKTIFKGMAPVQGVEQHLPRALLVWVWLSHTCLRSHLSTAGQGHSVGTRMVRPHVLLQEQGRGTTHSTASSSFLAPMRKEEFSAMKIGIPKICTVKKPQPQIGVISYLPLTE